MSAESLTQARPAPPHPQATHKWLVAIAVMLGTTLEVLDTSIINVALPHMQGTFSASVDEIGARMSQNRAVSHCYLRPVYEDWPYNLYTIVHGRSVDECESIINDIATDTGIRDKQALYPTKEYKKARIMLFSTEAEEWEAAHGGQRAATAAS